MSLPSRINTADPACAGWAQQPAYEAPIWQAGVLAEVPVMAHAFTGAGYNMSVRVGPDVAGTRVRHAALCRRLGLSFAHLVAGRQVHGTRIAAITEPPSTSLPPAILPDVDGLVTRLPDVPLLAFSADCPLILVVDPEVPALALGHSGWRGTAGNLAAALIETMERACDAVPARCVAVIAPCAGGPAYEIRQDVIDQLPADAVEQHVQRSDGCMHLDLAEMIVGQLQRAGLSRSFIHQPGLCTIGDERFYSYRRNGAHTGHGGLIAGLLRG